MNKITLADISNPHQLVEVERTKLDQRLRKRLVSHNATTFYDRDLNLQGVYAAARRDRVQITKWSGATEQHRIGDGQVGCREGQSS